MTATRTPRPLRTVSVTAWPRLHFGLLDLAHATGRRYGGAGCSISGPTITVTAHAAERWQIQGLEHATARTQRDALALLDRLDRCGYDTATLDVQALAPEHVGLGSKTALLLSLAAAATSVSGAEVDRELLQRVSGRGGTSGAGINLFFDGGFVLDAGHPDHPDEPFGPSSRTVPQAPPPVLRRRAIPSGWTFHLLLPDAPQISGSVEQALFARSTPLSRQQTLQTIRAVRRGIVAGFERDDLGLLAWGLRQTHAVGFKRCEVVAQPLPSQRALSVLQARDDCACGLSSVGPLLFAVTADSQSAASVREIATHHRLTLLGAGPGINHGHALLLAH